MGTHIRFHDWARTPLGPPADWTPSLRTLVGVMAGSGQPMFVAWGPERTLLYNDAYAPLLGRKHPGALGRPFFKVWPEIRDDIAPLFDRVFAGEAIHMDDIALTLDRHGRPEEAHFAFSYTPVRGERGEVAGLFCPCTETTAAVLADQRQAFRLALDERLRDLAAPREVMAAAAALLGQHLGASRVGYGEMEADDNHVVVVEEWNALSSPSLVGRHRLGSYGPMFEAEYLAGRTVVIGDMDADPRSAGQEAARAHAAVGIRAQVVAPLVKGGRLAALLFVHAALPRSWAGEDVALVREVAERTWSAVERARAEDVLRASEERWRGLFERLQEGLILGELVRDAAGRAVDWRYVEVNPTWGRLTGVPPEVAVGNTIRELFPDLGDEWVSEMATVVDTGQPATFTRQVGEFGRWYEGRAHRVGPERFAVIFMEVTERRRTEARRLALVELGDRIRDLDDPAELSFAAAEILGRALGVSRAGYGTVDTVAETIAIERDWNAPGIQSLAGLLRFRDYGSYVEDLRRGETVVFADAETDPRTAATSEALKAISARAVVNMPVTEQGGLVALLYLNHAAAREWPADELAFVREVAERTRTAVARLSAERELRVLTASLELRVRERTAERNLLAKIVETTDVMIMVSDLDFNILAINQANADEFERIYGTRPKVGDNMLGLLAGQPEHQAQVRATWGRGLAGEEVTIIEDFGDPDRERPYYEIKFRTLRDDQGKRVGCYQFVTDVTGRLREQAELAEAQDKLRQSQKMEAVGQLTGGLAHDFNNLLAGISGSLELLQARVAQGRMNDLDRYLVAAQGAAKRAAALTHRLLAFTRRQTLDPKPTDVNRLVAGMEELVRRTVGPQVAVEIVGAGGLWTTLVDPNQLENALLNLCINARDAMPDGGRLTIETSNKWLDERTARSRDLPPGQYVTLCVSDTGTGMTPEVARRAFDPFFTTKPIGMGTGLGLSMIYGFVQQSGGQARIYSEPGQGAMVCLYLPRHHGEADDADTSAELATALRAGQGETVLVVDDEPTVRMLVTEVLEELGYTAIEAADGPAGLKVLRSDVRLDLLVTDVGLPGGMNGRQVADAGRAVRPDLKVLFITGYAENAVLSHGHLDAGMHVLTKPFAMEALASRIRELIASSQEKRAG